MILTGNGTGCGGGGGGSGSDRQDLIVTKPVFIALVESVMCRGDIRSP
jgi:hypothetical protein